MKIAIIGAGAMGCLYGGKLSTVSENTVFLLDVWKDHVEAINSHGLCIEEDGKNLCYDKLSAFTNAENVGIVDLAIVFVKSTLTAQAMESNKAVFGKETLVLTLQNGLGNIDIIKQFVDEKNIIAGTTAHGATLLEAGKIRHAGVGLTVIGRLDGAWDNRIQEVANIFNMSKMETRISDKVMGLIWDKLLVNIGINALTAITGLKNGHLLHYPEIEEILTAAVMEGAAVAKAKEVPLCLEDPVSHTKEVCRATAENRSSMLQDMLHGKKTEIEMINGAVVREAKLMGIDTPVNQVLTNLVRFLERDEVRIQK